jgi:hypothetical protein
MPRFVLFADLPNEDGGTPELQVLLRLPDATTGTVTINNGTTTSSNFTMPSLSTIFPFLFKTCAPLSWPPL